MKWVKLGKKVAGVGTIKELLRGVKDISFTCCFCGKPIEGNAEVTIIIEETEQYFWSHKKCLTKRMCSKHKKEVLENERKGESYEKNRQRDEKSRI